MLNVNSVSIKHLIQTAEQQKLQNGKYRRQEASLGCSGDAPGKSDSKVTLRGDLSVPCRHLNVVLITETPPECGASNLLGD